MNPHHFPHPLTRVRAVSVSREENAMNAVGLFLKFDKDKDNHLSREEFILGLESIGDLIDLSGHEAGRLFDKLDVHGTGSVGFDEFQQACMDMRWLRTLSKLFAAVENHIFMMKEDYDFTKTTTDNYAVHNNKFVGEFADIRATLDYSYHSNYTPERQQWQDFAIKCCLGKTEAHARPWIIYTCGPMGVGKGHVLSWLSKRGLFPVEYIVHIDPDFFKRIMPEWSTYVCQNREFAGTACHKESGYLQEIAQEVSMRERQHIWVDGSLSDGDWFKNIFLDIRKRFPHYRIAIFYISASEATVRARVAKRTAETGRSIPESQIIRSLQSPEASLRILAPYTDIVARIWNENMIQLKCVEDYSGNWYRGLGRLFDTVEGEELKFPHSLGTLYLEKTSLLGSPFVLFEETKQRQLSVTGGALMAPGAGDRPVMEGYLEKEGRFRIGMSKRYFRLRPGFLAYYRDDRDMSLKGEFCLHGNFELLPNLESDAGHGHACPAAASKKRASTANSLVGAVMGALNPVAGARRRIDTETGFYIRGFHPDGSGYSLALVAPNADAKMEWIAAINSEIAKAKNSDLLPTTIETEHPKGGLKDTVTLEIARGSLVASPNLRILSTRLNAICIEASPIFPWTSKECDTQVVVGAPPNTTHFRFLFPSQQVQSMMHKTLVTGVEDPDVLLLLFGGFAYLDQDENILGVMAISETPSQQCLTFSRPEPLPAPDAARLSAASRWDEVRIPHMMSSGVKYFTYIMPAEVLTTTRKYPPNGSLAFLFREPVDPPDARDCFFALLYDY